MKLTFVGADHQVTGSCHYLQACGRNILVDCGMQQGINPYECCDIPVEEAKLDYVFLTHAHVDHSGNLPLLYAKSGKSLWLHFWMMVPFFSRRRPGLLRITVFIMQCS